MTATQWKDYVREELKDAGWDADKIFMAFRWMNVHRMYGSNMSGDDAVKHIIAECHWLIY